MNSKSEMRRIAIQEGKDMNHYTDIEKKIELDFRKFILEVPNYEIEESKTVHDWNDSRSMPYKIFKAAALPREQKIAELEKKIDSMGDMNHEYIKELREALDWVTQIANQTLRAIPALSQREHENQMSAKDRVEQIRQRFGLDKD